MLRAREMNRRGSTIYLVVVERCWCASRREKLRKEPGKSSKPSPAFAGDIVNDALIDFSDAAYENMASAISVISIYTFADLAVNIVIL